MIAIYKILNYIKFYAFFIPGTRPSFFRFFSSFSFSFSPFCPPYLPSPSYIAFPLPPPFKDNTVKRLLRNCSRKYSKWDCSNNRFFASIAEKSIHSLSRVTLDSFILGRITSSTFLSSPFEVSSSFRSFLIAANPWRIGTRNWLHLAGIFGLGCVFVLKASRGISRRCIIIG